MNRRTFIRLSSFTAANLAIASGLGGCVTHRQPRTNATFTHGVASGDPLHDSVIIWTRAVPDNGENQADILWEISDTASFSTIAASDIVQTKASHDYTIKVDVTGLRPAQRYFYRFRSADTTSVVGQTRTLPQSDISQVTFGVFSCSNYPAGFFTPYAHAATDDDIDYVLHLGDYIYEYPADGYATEHAKEIGRMLPDDNSGEIISLADYRKRYALYRTDAGLQALHQTKPFIVVWDDHEITNDTYIDGAENHQPDEGDFYARRAAAVQAYYEWLPIRPPFGAERLEIYRRFTFGNLLDLYMLDTRVLARDKQLSYADYQNPATGELDGQHFEQALTDPARNLLGEAQRTWLSDAMTSSQAHWQILGQQLLIGRMTFPVSVFNGVPQQQIASHVHALAQIKRKQLRSEPLSQQEQNQLASVLPYNLDAWDGYPAERNWLLNLLEKLNKPVIALAGDTHNAWQNNLTLDNGTVVATGTGSAQCIVAGYGKLSGTGYQRSPHHGQRFTPAGRGLTVL